MISLAQWALKQDISTRRARILADAGRIAGAVKIGKNWAVPGGAKFKRLKAGRPKSK